MPDRCDSRCSIVTSSPINGRSPPSTDRAVVESSSAPSSMRLDDRERGQTLRGARGARTACRACSGSRGRGARARTRSRARRRHRGRRARPRRSRSSRQSKRPRVPASPRAGRYRAALRRRNELGAPTRVEDPPELQVHANLGRRLLRRRCVRPVDFRHAFVDRVRGESGTPEVSAEVVQKRRVVDEDTHGPQSQSFLRPLVTNPQSLVRGGAHEHPGLGCLEGQKEERMASTSTGPAGGQDG